MNVRSKTRCEGEAPAEPERDGSELPEGWASGRLDSIAELNPRHPSGLDDSELVTFVPMTCVSESSPDIDRSIQRPLGEVRKGYTHFADGDVLFAKITPCMENGKGAVATGLKNGLGCGTTELHVIRPLGGIHPHYVYRFLQQESVRRDAAANFTGSAGQLRAPMSFIAELELPLAPLAEQRRIVGKLELLLGKVSSSQRRLSRVPGLLKRFRQSVLAAACSGKLTADWRDGDIVSDELPESWASVAFDSLMQCKPQNGLYKPQSSYSSGTRIVRIDAFYDGAIAPWEELKRLELTADEIALYGLSNGELLINRVNSMKFLGKSALVRELSEPCVFESNMMRVRLKRDAVDPEYAVLYLQSWPGLQELRKNAKHAVNQSSINQDDVRSVAFNLPPQSEQQEIVRRVEKLFAFADQIEARLRQAQAHVDRLTQSLLRKAFRGELVPTEAELARKEGRDYETASGLLERIQTTARTESQKPQPKRRPVRNK